jgi:hypothetical protein
MGWTGRQGRTKWSLHDQNNGLGLPQELHQSKDQLFTPKDRKIIVTVASIVLRVWHALLSFLILKNSPMTSAYYFLFLQNDNSRVRI